MNYNIIMYMIIIACILFVKEVPIHCFLTLSVCVFIYFMRPPSKMYSLMKSDKDFKNIYILFFKLAKRWTI